jgi:hypothetical protein
MRCVLALIVDRRVILKGYPEELEEGRILFDFWERTLAEIMDDSEHADGHDKEEESTPLIRDPYEEIPGPLLGPFPNPGGLTEQGRMVHRIGFRGI